MDNARLARLLWWTIVASLATLAIAIALVRYEPAFVPTPAIRIAGAITYGVGAYFGYAIAAFFLGGGLLILTWSAVGELRASKSLFPRLRSIAIHFWLLNLIALLFMAIFLDGGAYFHGRTEGDRFLIDNSDGIRQVSRAWFWFTFWHGFAVCATASLYALVASGHKLIFSFKESRGGNLLQAFVLFALAVALLLVVGVGALRVLG